jgi:hypothetical protein
MVVPAIPTGFSNEQLREEDDESQPQLLQKSEYITPGRFSSIPSQDMTDKICAHNGQAKQLRAQLGEFKTYQKGIKQNIL